MHWRQYSIEKTRHCRQSTREQSKTDYGVDFGHRTEQDGTGRVFLRWLIERIGNFFFLHEGALWKGLGPKPNNLVSSVVEEELSSVSLYKFNPLWYIFFFRFTVRELGELCDWAVRDSWVSVMLRYTIGFGNLVNQVYNTLLVFSYKQQDTRVPNVGFYSWFSELSLKLRIGIISVQNFINVFPTVAGITQHYRFSIVSHVSHIIYRVLVLWA